MNNIKYLISISREHFENNFPDWNELTYSEQREIADKRVLEINSFLAGVKNSKSPFKLYKITDSNNIELHGIKILAVEENKPEADTPGL
jgi:hypothetical protein